MFLSKASFEGSREWSMSNRDHDWKMKEREFLYWDSSKQEGQLS